jgi:hypothetical protein
MTFSKQKLEYLMAEHGLTCYAADKKCGFVGFNSGAATGETWAILHGRKPNADTLWKLANGFGVPMEYFFEENPA